MTPTNKLRLVIVLLWLAGGVASAGAQPAFAQDITQEAAAFVQSVGDQAMAVLGDRTLTPSDRGVRFRDLFVNHFDVAAIGQFVLGRYWRSASDRQRTEFLQLFEVMLVKAYNTRFVDYTGEQFSVDATRHEGANHALVTSSVARPNSPPVKVDWRVLRRGGRLKIVDILVEGVSMSLAQQQEFGAVIQRNGGRIEALLEAMRARV